MKKKSLHIISLVFLVSLASCDTKVKTAQNNSVKEVLLSYGDERGLDSSIVNIQYRDDRFSLHYDSAGKTAGFIYNNDSLFEPIKANELIHYNKGLLFVSYKDNRHIQYNSKFKERLFSIDYDEKKQIVNRLEVGEESLMLNELSNNKISIIKYNVAKGQTDTIVYVPQQNEN